LSIINNCSSVRYYVWQLRSAILLAHEMMNEWTPTCFLIFLRRNCSIESISCANLHMGWAFIFDSSMPAMNYFDSNRTNTVIFNHSWTVCTRHLVAVPFTSFGNLNWFWNICIWTRYFKTKIWMLTWKTYLLCIFQHRFDWTIPA
jgi:hypothetical protein